MKLISNTEFGKSLTPGEMPKEVFEKWQISEKDYANFYIDIRRTYDNFLSMPLKLEMFVPCDEEGNVLEEPKSMAEAIINNDPSKEWAEQVHKYRKAKEKVLFKGFSFDTNDNNVKTVFDEPIERSFELEWVYGENYFVQETYDVDLNYYLLIEDLVNNGLVLSNTALKQLGLDTSMNASAI